MFDGEGVILSQVCISAISDYNEQSIIRKKIINNSKVEKYVNCEQCTDDNGGILIYVHSPKNKKLVYLIFQWSLLFVEQTWQIEQYFVIEPDEAGSNCEYTTI